MTNGIILYEGASRIDGKPIVAILTGLSQPSNNPKTGPMAQTYILKADTHPLEAIKDGSDSSICGDCSLRLQPSGIRRCYVNPMVLGQIWKCYQKDGYLYFCEFIPQHKLLLEYRLQRYGLRIGSYGDPTAVPIEIWHSLIEIAKPSGSVTGYTAQWRQPQNQGYRHFLMASCNSTEDAKLAWQMGWRTYRIDMTGELQQGEITCPGSIEAGKSIECSQCKICSGADGKQRSNVVIQPHGHAKTEWRN